MRSVKDMVQEGAGFQVADQIWDRDRGLVLGRVEDPVVDRVWWQVTDPVLQKVEGHA